MTGTNCDLFTHKSVPVIFEPPCTYCRSTIFLRNPLPHWCICPVWHGFKNPFAVEIGQLLSWPSTNSHFHLFHLTLSSHLLFMCWLPVRSQSRCPSGRRRNLCTIFVHAADPLNSCQLPVYCDGGSMFQLEKPSHTANFFSQPRL